MNILFVMDPVKKCNPQWDNSLYLLGELTKRGHSCWTATIPDIQETKSLLTVRARLTTIRLRDKHRVSLRVPILHKTQAWYLKNFDLILIRKDPPFNKSYLRLTHLLEKVSNVVPVVNDPAGIRNNNEKLSILNFPKWIPKTLVSNSPEKILRFHQMLSGPMVVKPLDDKGGRGVFLLAEFSFSNLKRLYSATKNKKRKIMAQAFIKTHQVGEKRIVLLNGKLLTAYRKQPSGCEFRGNLDLGASFHPCRLTTKEQQLLKELKPFLIREKLYFAGVDTLEEKLIEINVTSPAGITEAKVLYPKQRFVEAWADFLEHLAQR